MSDLNNDFQTQELIKKLEKEAIKVAQASNFIEREFV